MQKQTCQFIVLGVAAMAIIGLGGCAVPGKAGQSESTVYVAKLQPLNTNVTGQSTHGRARLTVKNETLDVLIKVKNAPPDTVHWQHLHGFADGNKAACATSAADTNGDGIVDLVETESASGTTMVPFDGAPVVMDVAHGRYPKASGDGSYTYRQSVSLGKLKHAFAEAFDGGKLDLTHRVIYIHGVPETTDLPPTVASLGPIPAQVTMPIACGKIERIK